MQYFHDYWRFAADAVADDAICANYSDSAAKRLAMRTSMPYDAESNSGTESPPMSRYAVVVADIADHAVADVDRFRPRLRYRWEFSPVDTVPVECVEYCEPVRWAIGFGRDCKS